MGGRHSKITSTSINSDFCPLRIASIYIDLGESINKTKKIKAMVEYFMHDYYGYKIDVLCMQGIKSYKILKELVREFKTYITEYNDKNAKNGKDIYLEYFPDIEIKEAKNEMEWSTSETEETDFYDKLIITRHEILSKATPPLGVRDNGMHDYMANSYTNQEFLNRGENIMFNRDSDNTYDGRRHIQVVNLNVNGTYISLYNVELKSDVKGIRSNKERKSQIFDLKELINQNATNAKDDRVREFEYGDDKYIAHNRNIHIITGMFNINEMRNDEFNPEYVRTMKVLDGLDTHRWIMAFRNRVKPESTNISYSKNSYTLLISHPILDVADLQGKAKTLYQEYKTLITSSIIMRNSVDMSYFTNYPIDTLFMIYKPKLGYVGGGPTRPDYFIKQEVYSRLTKTVQKEKSRRFKGQMDDYQNDVDDDEEEDLQSMHSKHKNKQNIHPDVLNPVDGRNNNRNNRNHNDRNHDGRNHDGRNIRNDNKMRVERDDSGIVRPQAHNDRSSSGNRDKQPHKNNKINNTDKTTDNEIDPNNTRERITKLVSVDKNPKRDTKKSRESKDLTKDLTTKNKKSKSKKKVVTIVDDREKLDNKRGSDNLELFSSMNVSALDLMIDRYEPPSDTVTKNNSKDTILSHDVETKKDQSKILNNDNINDIELKAFNSRVHVSDGSESSSPITIRHPRGGGDRKDIKIIPKNNDDHKREPDPTIHLGKSLKDRGTIDIDTDSEDDLANDEMLRIMDTD